MTDDLKRQDLLGWDYELVSPLDETGIGGGAEATTFMPIREYRSF